MKFEYLRSAAKTITMPEDMKHRIAHNCRKQLKNTMKTQNMQHPKHISIFRRQTAVFAVLAVTLSLSVTVLAHTDVLQGFFRDVTNFSGAIVGTSYEQATDEMDMVITVNDNELTVLVTFANPDKLPYRDAELLGIAEYKIVNADGKYVKEGTTNQSFPVINGQAAIVIELNEIEPGSYKLIVNAFLSEKKTDQPLRICGIWTAEFNK